MRIAISLPHGGKSPDVDAGSTSDANHDGKIQYQEREEYLGAIYAAAVASRLRTLRHDVRVYGDGDYSSRAADMRAYRPDVILYPHLDVRSRTNPLVFHDPASPAHRGPALADAIGRTISAALPQYGLYRALAATSTASPGGYRICLLHRQDPSIVIITEPLPTAIAADLVLHHNEAILATLGAAIAEAIDSYGRNGVHSAREERVDA